MTQTGADQGTWSDSAERQSRWGDSAEDPRQSQNTGEMQGQRSGQQQQRQQGEVNVADDERAVSVAAGSILALLGLSRGSLPGLIIAGLGGGMIYRGATGRCPAYARLGVNTAEEQQRRQQEEPYDGRAVHIAQAFLINKPAEQLYSFWRNFENLPRIMTHLESVRVIDERRSHWVAKSTAIGKQFEWDAEITRDEPNSLIAWRSVDNPDVENSGEIRFSKGMGDRGTEVHVQMDYVPPAGRIGHMIASMLGNNPKRVVREDLRNFKRIMELGEILTIIGQPHGTCTGQGERYTESEWKPLFT